MRRVKGCVSLEPLTTLMFHILSHPRSYTRQDHVLYVPGAFKGDVVQKKLGRNLKKQLINEV